MKLVYYDTNVFWRFFEYYINEIPVQGECAKYSPKQQKFDIRPVTSPWTLEEFFFKYIQEKRNEVKLPIFKTRQIRKNIEKLSEIHGYLALFKQDDIDTRSVNYLFITLFMLARDKDILALKQNDKKRIDPMDLLHFSYALKTGCELFLTMDNDFKFLEKKKDIQSVIKSHKLKRIIVVSDDLTEIKSKIIL